MNLPNKLTMLRILLIPIMVVFAYISPLQEIDVFLDVTLANFLMVIIFVVASLTDFLDGYLARKYDQVTTFGKFADPLADKLLVMAALIILMNQEVVSGWLVIIIIAREFIVTGIRLLAVEGGKVIAASKLGKYKTATTMVAIIILFFHEVGASVGIINGTEFDLNNPIFFVGNIIMYIALVLTILSGVDYFIKNRKIIFESK